MRWPRTSAKRSMELTPRSSPPALLYLPSARPSKHLKPLSLYYLSPQRTSPTPCIASSDGSCHVGRCCSATSVEALFYRQPVGGRQRVASRMKLPINLPELTERHESSLEPERMLTPIDVSELQHAFPLIQRFSSPCNANLGHRNELYTFDRLYETAQVPKAIVGLTSEAQLSGWTRRPPQEDATSPSPA